MNDFVIILIPNFFLLIPHRCTASTSLIHGSTPYYPVPPVQQNAIITLMKNKVQIEYASKTGTFARIHLHQTSGAPIAMQQLIKLKQDENDMMFRF